MAMMMTMTNQERKCVFCPTLIVSPQRASASKEDETVFRKFCEEILPSDTLDELQNIPGNEFEFETACKKCEHKLSSILRTNRNVMEEEKLISNLCEETVTAIQDLVETDGNSMLSKLKRLQDPAQQSSSRVTDCTGVTACNIVIRKGMEKATKKFEGRQELLRKIMAAVKKLTIGFAVKTLISRTETDENCTEKVVPMANDNDSDPEVPEDRSNEMDIGPGPVLPAEVPKTEPSSDTPEEFKGLSELSATPNISAVNNVDQIVDLSSNDDDGEGDSDDDDKNLSGEASQIQQLSTTTASVADMSSVGLYGNLESESSAVNEKDRARARVTEKSKLDSCSSSAENESNNNYIASIVTDSPPVPRPHHHNNSPPEEVSVTVKTPESVEGTEQIMMIQEAAGLSKKKSKSTLAKEKPSGIPDTPNPKKGNVRSLSKVKKAKTKKANDNNKNPTSQKVRTTTATAAFTLKTTKHCSSSSVSIQSSSAENLEVEGKGNRKRKLPQSLNDAAAAGSGKNPKREGGIDNPQKAKTKTRKNDLTKSAFEIDHATLKIVAAELKTAVRNIDVEKIKSLLKRIDAQEILKRCTSPPENQRKWKEYKELSTIIHKCIHRSSKFKEEHPKNLDISNIIEALIKINKELLETIELRNLDRRDRRTPIIANGIGPCLISKLIEFGANPFAVNSQHRTFLHDLPFSSQLCKFLAKKHPNIISRLVKMKDLSGRTPLLSSLMCDYYDSDLSNVFQVFHNAGADFNAIDHSQNSPLSVAIVESHRLEVIKLLIHFGGSLLWKGEGNKSLLHLATQNGNKEAVRFLINEKGFDVNIEDCEGLTPLDYLAFKILPKPNERGEKLEINEQKNRYFEIGLMLTKGGGSFKTKSNNRNNNQSLLHFVAANPSRYTNTNDDDDDNNNDHQRYRGWEVELLLRLDFPVNGIDAEGNTPLHLAYESGSGIRRCDCEQRSRSHHHYHRKMWMEKKEVIDILLRSGADVNAVNNMGKTPREMINDSG